MASALAGCGGTPYADRPDAVMDDGDAGDDAGPTGPITVTVKTHRAPKLVAYREGPRPWTSVQVDERGEFQIVVTGRYEVAVVCGRDLAPPLSGSDYVTQIARATAADGPALVIPCEADNPQVSPGYRITGQMLQAGRLGLDHTQAESASAPWQFTLHARAGLHDLVATDNQRVLIRRDYLFITNIDLGTIDVGQGHALVPTPFTVHGVQPDDTPLESLVVLDLPSAVSDGDHDEILLSSGGPGVLVAKLAPAQALLEGDRQRISFHTDGGTPWTYRSVSADVPQSTELTLPERLTGIAVTPNGATWSVVNGEGDYTMRIGSDAALRDFRTLQVRASQSWLSGATQLEVDLDIPGYQAWWKIVPSELSSYWPPQLTRTQRVGGIETVSLCDA